jgi:4-amino-4-deoxy-L-arabinose transferase-like glycosyltransferase
MVLSTEKQLPGSEPSSRRYLPIIKALLATYALLNILFIVFLWFNHAAFPLNLEAMELTRLQHLKRILAGLPLYPEPSPDFVALAYNPLSYYITVPFAWILGANLFTMRLVAILGMLGSGILIFLTIRKQTGSKWWALMGLGLFAAAYRAMDTYLDNAHTDSLLLCSILLGCYFIDQNRSQATKFLGVLCLVAAFWFKQQGALFTMGGIAYLFWRNGWRKSLLPLSVVLVLGPGLYIFAPDWLFGPKFHYFTWQVPRHWTEFTRGEYRNFVQLVIKRYTFLALAGSAIAALTLWKTRRNVSIWYFMFPVAFLSGIIAPLSTGSNNNVFIPMGTWFIIVGVLGFKHLSQEYSKFRRWNLHLVGLVASFLLLLYNPLSVISSPQATSVYKDLIGYLKSLDGTVYAPWLGQLANGYEFSIAVHLVPLEDIIRGPGVNESNHPLTRKLLAPVFHPKGNAYILQNVRLEDDELLKSLMQKYAFEADLGNRFKPLTTLPKRFTLNFPRFLYRYVP